MAERKQIIKCSECEYCEGIRPRGNTRTSFSCNHPDQRYINTYFVQHKIRKMPGFLGFGAVYSEAVPLKTAPAWCPKKKDI